MLNVCQRSAAWNLQQYKDPRWLEQIPPPPPTFPKDAFVLSVLPPIPARPYFPRFSSLCSDTEGPVLPSDLRYAAQMASVAYNQHALADPP